MNKVNIIIAEDEPIILNLIKNIINSLGNEFNIVSTALNGKNALELILKHKPHIVITDIRMPLLSGIDVIKEARSNAIVSKFIILTGYSNFDYAVSAIQLGVVEYMLKPINPDKLSALLNKMRDEVYNEEQAKQLSYIKHKLGFNTSLKVAENPLQGLRSYLIFLYLGPITDKIYNVLGMDFDYLNNTRNKELKNISKNHNVNIIYLNGKYPNEKIIVISYTKGLNINLSHIALEIFDLYKSIDIFKSLIVSANITNGKNLFEIARRSNSYAIDNILFGKSKIYRYSSKKINHENITVSDYIKEMSNDILFINTIEQLENTIKNLISYWENNNLTQVKLQFEIAYLINICANKKKINNLWEAKEIVFVSYNYNDLYVNLLSKIKQLLKFENSIKHCVKRSAKDLIDTIEEYLNNNYTKTITYKVFYDMFGYNEKYITKIFKDEKGITPSKYVMNLRINHAKRLLKNNPNMLLKDVASIVGYSDPLYFSRVFKDVIGYSPSKFIKLLHEIDN